MSNKMLTFNYSDAKCIVICGDVHGAWFNASWESDTESAQKMKFVPKLCHFPW